MPFGFAVNVAIDIALNIVTNNAEWKLTGKVSGDNLAFGLISIISPLTHIATLTHSLTKYFKK